MYMCSALMYRYISFPDTFLRQSIELWLTFYSYGLVLTNWWRQYFGNGWAIYNIQTFPNAYWLRSNMGSRYQLGIIFVFNASYGYTYLSLISLSDLTFLLQLVNNSFTAAVHVPGTGTGIGKLFFRFYCCENARLICLLFYVIEHKTSLKKCHKQM